MKHLKYEKIFYIFILFFIIISVNAENCDFEVKINSKNVFENSTDFKFEYEINNLYGNKTSITLMRTIEYSNGSEYKDYDDYIKNVTHTLSNTLNPNLKEGAYLLKGNLSTECNDTNLENNYIEKLILIQEKPIIYSQDFSKIRINEFLSDPQGNDDSEMPDGEWIELYNEGDESINLENLSLKDNYGEGQDIFISNSNTVDGTIIEPKGYLIVYMNGRSGFLNNEGFEKISLLNGDNIIDEISYSGSKEGLSWSKVNNKWVLRYPSPNKENPEKEQNFDSILNIERVYLGNDDIAKFGDSIDVRVNILKGNTSKYAVYLYLEKDGEVYSEKTSLNIFEKYNNFTFMLPLNIDTNCDNKLKDGNYSVVLTGLDKKREEEIEVKGNNEKICKVVEKKVIEKQKETSINPSLKENINEKISQNTTGITGEVIYESSDVKAQRIGLYIFSLVLLLFIIHLLIKK